MSCDRQGVKVGLSAGMKAGISTLGSKASNITGRMMNTAGRGVGRSATAMLSISNSFEGPGTLDALTPLAAVGALLSRNNNTRLKILNALTAAQVARAAATSLGTGLARLSRPGDEAIRTEFYFKGQPAVRAWSSRLTPALNARDITGWPRLSVEFSGGQIVEAGGKSWHVGTTVVKTPKGGPRAITHVQSLAVPGRHYYFNRPLKDREVAGIILGQKGFEAKHLPGFAGQIGELESLQPTMAGLKKGLIQAHVFWGKDEG